MLSVNVVRGFCQILGGQVVVLPLRSMASTGMKWSREKGGFDVCLIV